MSSLHARVGGGLNRKSNSIVLAKHGLGISLGYHRLHTHRSFKVRLFAEYFLMSRYEPDLAKFRFYRWLNTDHWAPSAALGILLLKMGGFPLVLGGLCFRVVFGLHATRLANSATRDDSRNNYWVARLTLAKGGTTIITYIPGRRDTNWLGASLTHPSSKSGAYDFLVWRRPGSRHACPRTTWSHNLQGNSRNTPLHWFRLSSGPQVNALDGNREGAIRR